MHHELTHTLFSHLGAIFGDHEPIAIEPPAERNHQDEPLREDSHPKSDSAYSACTTEIVEGASAAAETPENPPYAPNGLSRTDRNQEMEHSGRERNTHNPDHNADLTSQPFELKMTEFHDETPGSTMPAGIPSIPNTNSTLNYPKSLGDPPNAPDGTSRGDDHKTAENGGQWQHTMREETPNDGMASPAPNTADRTSERTTGNGPIPFSRTQPKKTVKHQHKSTRYKPQPNRCANANTQHSNRHPKPIIHLPRQPRLPLKGERIGGATNGCTHSSSGQPMPQKPTTSPNKLDTLVTTSIKLESPHSIGISHVHLGGTSWHADDPNGPGNQTDGSHGQVDEPRGSADALEASYNAETAILGHGDGLGMYLRPGDAKCGIREMDGLGSQMDTSSGHSDMPSVKTDMLIPTIAPTIIRTTQKRGKPPNLPGQTANQTPHKSNGLRGHAHRSDVHSDMPSVGYDMETAKDKVEIISMCPIQSKSPNPLTMSANGHTNEMDGSRIHPDMLNVCLGVHSKTETPADEAGTISMHTIESEQPNPLTMGEKWPANEMNSCRN